MLKKYFKRWIGYFLFFEVEVKEKNEIFPIGDGDTDEKWYQRFALTLSNVKMSIWIFPIWHLKSKIIEFLDTKLRQMLWQLFLKRTKKRKYLFIRILSFKSILLYWRLSYYSFMNFSAMLWNFCGRWIESKCRIKTKK